MIVDFNLDENAANESYLVDLPDFFGPMDLLLSLIEQEDLEITQISLAKVTDQYLARINAMPDINADELADFLVVAAKLILIKSQVLLPKPPPGILDEDEEGDADDLVRQLQDYKRFKKLAQSLGEIQHSGGRSYVRVAPPPKIEPKLDMGDVTLGDLLTAVRHALAVKPDAPPVDTVVSRQRVTIGGQINTIRRKLRQSERLQFNELLAGASTKVEVIVTLLAVLELIKRQVIDVAQEESFGDIEIVKKEDAVLTDEDWDALTQMEDLS